MQQYEVPQFVDVEDKIFGPMTLKQFLTFLGGVFIIFVVWLIFSFNFIFWVISVPVFLLTVLLSFANFNGLSVLSSVIPFIAYIFLPKKRIFHRDSVLEVPEIKMAKKEDVQEKLKPQDVKTRLKRLSYVLDQRSQAEQELLSSNISNQTDKSTK